MTKIHLARPGTYLDMHSRATVIDAARIAALAASYRPGTAKAPLVIGHPADNDAAHGWIDSLEVDDKGDLWGIASDVTPELAAAVKAGRYRNVSISWWPKGHTSSPLPDTDTIRHVGILGAQVPAIPGLTPLSFAADDTGIVTVDFGAQRWGWNSVKTMFRGMRDWMIEREGKEAADRIMPDYLIDSFDDAADDAIEPEPAFTSQPEQKMPPTDPKTPPVDLAAQTADLERREADIKAREDAIDLAAATVRKDEAVSFAAGLVEKGLIAPSAKDVIADVHRRLAGSDEPISFSNGSSAPALASFTALFDSAVPVINFAAVSDPDKSSDETPGKGTAGITARAKKLQAENSALSFSAAVRQAEDEMEKA